ELDKLGQPTTKFALRIKDATGGARRLSRDEELVLAAAPSTKAEREAAARRVNESRRLRLLQNSQSGEYLRHRLAPTDGKEARDAHAAHGGLAQHAQGGQEVSLRNLSFPKIPSGPDSA